MLCGPVSLLLVLPVLLPLTACMLTYTDVSMLTYADTRQPPPRAACAAATHRHYGVAVGAGAIMVLLTLY